MRILVYEPCYVGHHYLYVQHLLPALLRTGAQVVLATSRRGTESAEFRDRLLPFADRVAVDAEVPEPDPSVPLAERWKVYRSFRGAVDRGKPDYTLVPTADSLTTVKGLAGLVGLGHRARATPGEACLHFGSGLPAYGLLDRVRDGVKVLTTARAGWAAVHVVNVVLYEHLVRKYGTRGGWLRLLPDPVAANPRVAAEESRRRLGIPTDGRYVGLAASLDPRKAIPELLAAFAAAARPDERLLLAGKLHPVFRRLIEVEYSGFLGAGRLQILDRYLNQDELQLALTASDVVCTPYPRFAHLSGTVLAAVSAGRPVLAHAFGWSKVVVERFRLGWCCDVLNPAAFSRAIRAALDESPAYRETEAARRLLAFHAPENFARCFVANVRERMTLAPEPELRSWEWVTQAL